MTNKITLNKFITDATATLRETESNLQQLAQIALTQNAQVAANQENGSTDSGLATLRLQQIGQQLTQLSERSRVLQQYLQNNLDIPPTNDDHWPRVRILQSQEEERSQIAHELEDTVGQLLANAVFELASCQYLLGSDDDAVAAGLTSLQSELEQGLADIRHVITNLEPSTILGNFGLGEGVRRYLEQFQNRTTIKTQLRVNTNIGRLPSIIEVAIFRVIQEALQNVQRHAKASQIDVVFEEKDSAVEFSIVDNGQGIALDKITVSRRKNLGLARMVDYAELLCGTLKVFSNSGEGTRVVLSVPYHIL